MLTVASFPWRSCLSFGETIMTRASETSYRLWPIYVLYYNLLHLTLYPINRRVTGNLFDDMLVSSRNVPSANHKLACDIKATLKLLKLVKDKFTNLLYYSFNVLRVLPANCNTLTHDYTVGINVRIVGTSGSLL